MLVVAFPAYNGRDGYNPSSLARPALATAMIEPGMAAILDLNAAELLA